jgi:Spherulation-specific family 4
MNGLSITTRSNYCIGVLSKTFQSTSGENASVPASKPRIGRQVLRTTAALLTSLTAIGGFAIFASSPSQAQANPKAVVVSGDGVLTGRALSGAFLNTLANGAQFNFIVINPFNGPGPVDGIDAAGSGYTPAAPDVDDFAIRAKLAVAPGGKVLGLLPNGVSPAEATTYKDFYSTDGVLLSGYDCAGAQSAVNTVRGVWSTAAIAISTPGCSISGVTTVDVTDAASLAPGSFNPNAGYPVASSTKLIVPAYFTDAAMWARLLTGLDDIGAVVVDFATRDTLRPYFAQLKAKGIKIYAYIPTGYLTKFPANAASSLSKIDVVNNDADMDGIFLDEVRSGCSVKAVADYTAMKNRTGKALIYNPGQTPGSCYFNIANAVVDYEGSYAAYQNWPAAAKGRSIGSNSVVNVIHTTSQSDISNAIALAKSRNAGLIWVSEGDTNSFQNFPSQGYFDAVRSALRGTVVVGSTVPPTQATVAPTQATVAPTQATLPTQVTSAVTAAPAVTQATTAATTATTPALSPGSGSGSATATATTAAAATTTSIAATSAVGAGATTTTVTTTAVPKAAAATATTAPTTAAAAPTTTSKTYSSAVLPVAPPPAKAQTASPGFAG